MLLAGRARLTACDRYWGCKNMHKRRFNEFTLFFAIRPAGPLLIKSGRESGADPTLLDMNFVRTHHAGVNTSTVYLPGSSLKGTLRSYAEKIARTLDSGLRRQPPLSCNPLGDSDQPGHGSYSCNKWMDAEEKRRKNKEPLSSQEKHARACPICRTFGHTSLAGHLRLSDAYPIDPAKPDDLSLLRAANATGVRDGVAIDRVSGAVAFGPFNLEVVTQGAFFGSFTLHNFQLWQIGLLAIVLRDLGQGRVPIGFGKSRGLGRVEVELQKAEVAYPGRFQFQTGDQNLVANLYGVDAFLAQGEVEQYGYQPERPLPLPAGFEETEKGDYGRISLVWSSAAAAEALLKSCVPAWADLVAAWNGVTVDG